MASVDGSRRSGTRVGTRVRIRVGVVTTSPLEDDDNAAMVETAVKLLASTTSSRRPRQTYAPASVSTAASGRLAQAHGGRCGGDGHRVSVGLLPIRT